MSTATSVPSVYRSTIPSNLLSIFPIIDPFVISHFLPFYRNILCLYTCSLNNFNASKSIVTLYQWQHKSLELDDLWAIPAEDRSEGLEREFTEALVQGKKELQEAGKEITVSAMMDVIKVCMNL